MRIKYFVLNLSKHIMLLTFSMSSTNNQGSLSTTGANDASSSMLMPGGGLGSHSNWLQGLDSPLIQEDAANAGQKELKLRFDVSQYTPEEIMVKTVDNKLLVCKTTTLYLCLVRLCQNEFYFSMLP